MKVTFKIEFQTTVWKCTPFTVSVALTELILYLPPLHFIILLETLKIIQVRLIFWLHAYAYACMAGPKNTTPYLGGSPLVRWPTVSSALCPVGINNQHLLHVKHSHAHMHKSTYTCTHSENITFSSNPNVWFQSILLMVF